MWTLKTSPVEEVARERHGGDDEDAMLDPSIEEERLDVKEDDTADGSKELMVENEPELKDERAAELDVEAIDGTEDVSKELESRVITDENIVDESASIELDEPAIQEPAEVDEAFELHETVMYIVFGS
ncbi:uncharacterized protein PAC_17140 [Phialocephala subalpina]|uniref:Uncharacterized protein n=1 Tax=Phialocephala subalpina TaxID=576137 RepID=A0A1L7XQB6_9HELO|nr:uncharacterized protein PAC_17140 [Phialocephala subalpina]